MKSFADGVIQFLRSSCRWPREALIHDISTVGLPQAVDNSNLINPATTPYLDPVYGLSDLGLFSDIFQNNVH